MKLLILMTNSDAVMWFRKNLILHLIQKNIDVIVVAHDSKRKEDIEKLGAKFYSIHQENRSINPFNFIKYFKDIKKIIKYENPDKIFTFQIKPNTIGILAAKSLKCNNIYAMVEGLGNVFINNTLKWKIIRFISCYLYKKSFKNINKVFFINEDDKKEFLKRKIVREPQCKVINGVGIDLDYFKKTDFTNYHTFIMVARMLKNKGVIEFCEAAKIVKNKYPTAIFNYLGGEATLKIEDIKKYVDKGIINYLGTTTDVRPYIKESSVIILPSYREGFGLCVAEAASMGRPAIVSNVVGCKDVVENGYNGLLVEKQDIQQLADKIIWFLNNPEQIKIMGNNARINAEKKFNQQNINSIIYNEIKD